MADNTFYPVARALMGLVFKNKDTGVGSPGQPLAFPVIPRSAKVQINSYRQPDSWELTFDARDLPFDPQKLRSGSVEISMFLTNGIETEKRLLSRQYAESEDASEFHKRDYVAVQKARKEQAALAASDRKSQGAEARRTYFESNEPLICGLFDDAGVNCSSDGRWATISGQDYTAFAMSRQWHPVSGRARRIPIGQRADDWARSILSEIDPDGTLSISVLGLEDDELPVIGKNAIGLHGRGIPIEAKTTYWDVLYKTLTRHGLLCYFRNLSLVITRPRNLEQIKTDLRYLAWGANLETVHLERHLGKERAPRIIVQYLDEHDVAQSIEEPPKGTKVSDVKLRSKVAGKTSFRYKTPKTAATAPKTPTLKETDEYEIVLAPAHLKDKESLQQYARLTRYLRGHGERTLKVTTHHLADLKNKPLMTLDVGDPVMIEWRDFNAQAMSAKAPEVRYQELVELGYQPEVAQAIADSFNDLVGDDRPMRVHEVTYDWDCEEGVSIDFAALDFITDSSQGTEDAPPPSKLSKALGKKTR